MFSSFHQQFSQLTAPLYRLSGDTILILYPLSRYPGTSCSFYPATPYSLPAGPGLSAGLVWVHWLADPHLQPFDEPFAAGGRLVNL